MSFKPLTEPSQQVIPILNRPFPAFNPYPKYAQNQEPEIKQFREKTNPKGQKLEQFDIRNFADRLTPKQGKNRYVCPVCEGTLTIAAESGKYHCWGKDCPKPAIREAIRPLEEALREAGIEPSNYTPKPKQLTSKKPETKVKPAIIPAVDISLGKLPQPVNPPARIVKGNNIEIIYPYSDTQQVLRIEKPDGTKIPLPKYIDDKGNLVTGKGNKPWNPYRFDEISQYGPDKWVLQVEGEKCTDFSRVSLQLLTFTFQGGSWSEKDLEKYYQLLKDAGVAGVVYFPDHDKTGYSKAKKCALAAAKVGLLFIEINPIRLWADCPKGGDIADWVNAGLANIDALHKEINLCVIDLQGQNAAAAIVERPELWDRWIKSRQFTPTITINQPELTDFDIPTRNAIIAIKSAMGTGKTRWLIKTIKNSPNRAFLLGCLNNLLCQTISVAGKEFNTQIYHLYLDDAGLLVADKDTYIACCVDSMHHLDGYFKGVDLYIDEICSVIASILSGGTLGERQAYIMKVFEKAIREANRVFILDANLSDIIADFIAKIDPTKAVVKVLNIAKPRPHHFKFVDGFNPDKNTINSRDKSPVIKAIRNSEKPFIASDSRKFINSISEVLNSEGKKGHGLSRDTVNEDWAKSFLNNPNEFLTSPLNYFGISPSANSGVSITDPCGFTDKISVFTGVLATNQQSQILMRLRPVLNHLIYCPESSTIQRDKIKAKTPYGYYNQVWEKITLSAELASDGSEPIAEVIRTALEKYKDDIWLDLSSKLGSLDNFERQNLRQCLIYALQEQGHTTEIINLEISKEDAQKLADANESLLKRQADETFKAEPLQDVQEANTLAKTSPKPEIMRRIEKTRLLDRLPGIDLTGIWDADFIYSTLKDQDFINKHSRFWMLNNLDISQKRSELKWYYGATGEYFYLGGMVRDAHLKIWALDQLNILQFADGRQYNKDSLEVIEFYNKALNDKKINTALGETIHPGTVTGKERIELLRKCMASVGLKLKFDGQKIINGTKQRLYSLDIEAFNDPTRLEIVNAVERKYSGYLSSEAVKKIDWTNHITPKTEEINQVPQFDDIFAAAEFIRELISGNAGWGFIQMHFAKFDEVSKKRIFQQLTVEEQTILKSLKPIDEEEIKAKELITIIKSGKDIQARCDRALENVENRQNLVYYLHPSYHYLLFPKSQDLVA